VVSRSISFMIVGVLFRLFGAPIKRFIDKYLGLVTAGFVILVVAGLQPQPCWAAAAARTRRWNAARRQSSPSRKRRCG
jgi:hypothetical protein